MQMAIIDLLQSAKILAIANDDKMLSYLIEMALLEARDSNVRDMPEKKAA